MIRRGDVVLVQFPLATVAQADILNTFGHLSAKLKNQLDACLKAALELP